MKEGSTAAGTLFERRKNAARRAPTCAVNAPDCVKRNARRPIRLALFGGCLGRQAQCRRGGRSRPLEVQAQRAAPPGAEASADRREGTTEPAGSRPKGSMRSTRGATRPQAGGPHKLCNVDLAQDSGKPRRATHSNSQEPAPDLHLRVPMRNQKPGGGIFGGSGLEPLVGHSLSGSFCQAVFCATSGVSMAPTAITDLEHRSIELRDHTHFATCWKSTSWPRRFWW